MPTPTKATIVVKDEIAQKATALLEFDFLDHAGVPLGVNPDTVDLTLCDKVTGRVINDRQTVDVLSFVTAGKMSFKLLEADTILVNTAKNREVHIALLEWTWNSGQRSGKGQIEMVIVDMVHVTN